MKNLTTYYGTHTNTMNVTSSNYSTTLDGQNYQVRAASYPNGSVAYIIKTSDSYGEIYSIYPDNELAQAIIAQVKEDHDAAVADFHAATAR